MTGCCRYDTPVNSPSLPVIGGRGGELLGCGVNIILVLLRLTSDKLLLEPARLCVSIIWIGSRYHTNIVDEKQLQLLGQEEQCHEDVSELDIAC